MPGTRDAQHGHALDAALHELEGGLPGLARRVARQQFGPALAVGFYGQGLREVEDLHTCNGGADKRDHPPLSPQAAFTQVRWLSVGQLLDELRGAQVVLTNFHSDTQAPFQSAEAPAWNPLAAVGGQARQRRAWPGLEQGPQQCCRASPLAAQRSTSGARCPSPSGTSNFQ